jgi:hypothetical protein
MRGLEPPRGSEKGGVVWRNVEFAGIFWEMVTPFGADPAGFTD